MKTIVNRLFLHLSELFEPVFGRHCRSAGGPGPLCLSRGRIGVAVKIELPVFCVPLQFFLMKSSWRLRPLLGGRLSQARPGKKCEGTRLNRLGCWALKVPDTFFRSSSSSLRKSHLSRLPERRSHVLVATAETVPRTFCFGQYLYCRRLRNNGQQHGQQVRHELLQEG